MSLETSTERDLVILEHIEQDPRYHPGGYGIAA